MDKPAYTLAASYNFIITVFVLLLQLPVAAQQPPLKLIAPQFELEHIKLNNKEDIGLFNDVAEDKQGYLWLTGTKGLYVFDGNRTVTYANGNKQFRLANDSINKPLYYFAKNRDGSFWIQEENDRFILFDPSKRRSTATFTNKYNKTDKFIFSAISNDGRLFTAVINYLKSRVSIYKKPTGDSLVEVYSAAINSQTSAFNYKIAGKNHWLIEQGRLTRISLDGKETEQYKLAGELLSYLYFIADKDDLYYINNNQNAICRWNSKTNKIEKFISLPEVVRGKLSDLYKINNTFYIGSNLSLFIIDNVNHTIQDVSPNFIEVAKKEAPNSFAIGFLKFFSRADSSFLVCTKSDIYRLKKKVPAAEQFMQKKAVTDNISNLFSFRGLAEDDKKNIYASYYTGILKKNSHENIFKAIATRQYLNSGLISTYSLNYWKGNLLWNNISINLATGKQTYLAGDKFGGHCTQYLHNDTVWLIQWNTAKLHCYDLKNGILSTYALDEKIMNGRPILGGVDEITGDATGQNLWISSNLEGISLVSKKGKLLKQYQANELSTVDNDIQELQLAGNKLWYGCKDGLGVLNTVTGKATVYKNPAIINNGVLQNRTVFSILPDTAGNFYLGSSYGLLYFNTQTSEFYNLAESHPLSKLEFNKTSTLRASDGRYYFGTTDGLYSFLPGELEFIKSSNSIRALKLFSISIFNSRDNTTNYLSQNLDSLSKLVLNPFDNNIEFSFSVPEYYKTIYYSYRIKGQSDIWTDYKPENKILLYGLPPGNHVLQVKVSTVFNDVNAQYFSLPIEMKQVWYKKIWVIVVASILFAFLLIGFLRFRFNQKLQRQKDLAALRTKISSDLHDDVGTILSGLAMQSQILSLSAKAETKDSLNEISNMSRDAMERMRDTVWAMDSRKDKLANLVDRMRDFAEKNLAMKNMTHEFILDNIETKKFINPEKRQAIYLIFKEAITNIIKHSDGKHVTIHFTENKNNLLLLIQDNGNIKPVSNSDGLGLSNMKMRAEKIGGQLKAGYNNGYQVILTIS